MERKTEAKDHSFLTFRRVHHTIDGPYPYSNGSIPHMSYPPGPSNAGPSRVTTPFLQPGDQLEGETDAYELEQQAEPVAARDLSATQ